MKSLGDNKKAYFDYEVLEKFEAGLVLIGQEVKSIKLGRINLSGAYVILRGGEVYLTNANVPPYQPKNLALEYDPARPRKLLLRKSEIKYLIGKTAEKRLTLIPLRVYANKGKIKLEFAIARGKRKTDKRETIKKRDTKREIERALKGNPFRS